nr:hypothetical protein [Tanacetum cinerariifolium]
MGVAAWDAECNLGQHNSHMTITLFEKLSKQKLDVYKYGRRIVINGHIEIHGYKFGIDLVVDEYEGTTESSVVFRRDFLLGSKCTMNFGLGEMKINMGELQDDKDVDWLLEEMLIECGDEGIEPLQPLSPMQEAKTIKSMANKFKELLKEKPIFHVLENYTYYRKMLDEVSMDKRRLEMKEEIEEEEVAKIIEGGLPKKMDDLENYIVPLKVNGTTSINALADTGTSVSFMPYKLYKVLGHGKAPSNDKLLMADNTIEKAYGKVRNVRLKIRFQAYLCDFQVLHIQGIMTIEDGVVKHVYHAKKRNKIVVDEDSDEEDWLDAFEVGCDKKGNPKYGPTLPPFFDTKDEIECALAMEAYFNPTYRKIEGDEDWQAKFEIMNPSGHKFTIGFKTKETKRKLLGKFNSDDILSWCSNCQLDHCSGSSGHRLGPVPPVGPPQRIPQPSVVVMPLATRKAKSIPIPNESNPIVTQYARQCTSKKRKTRQITRFKSDHFKWKGLDENERSVKCNDIEGYLHLVSEPRLRFDSDLGVKVVKKVAKSYLDSDSSIFSRLRFVKNLAFFFRRITFCLQRYCVLPWKHCVLPKSRILRFVSEALRFAYVKNLAFCL